MVVGVVSVDTTLATLTTFRASDTNISPRLTGVSPSPHPPALPTCLPAVTCVRFVSTCASIVCQRPSLSLSPSLALPHWQHGWATSSIHPSICPPTVTLAGDARTLLVVRQRERASHWSKIGITHDCSITWAQVRGHMSKTAEDRDRGERG